MTTSQQHPGPRRAPEDPRGLRDRGLRLARRLTSTLVAVSAALILGFSGLAATTAGSLGGHRDAAALVAPEHAAAAGDVRPGPAPAVTSGAS